MAYVWVPQWVPLPIVFEEQQQQRAVEGPDAGIYGRAPTSYYPTTHQNHHLHHHQQTLFTPAQRAMSSDPSASHSGPDDQQQQQQQQHHGDGSQSWQQTGYPPPGPRDAQRATGAGGVFDLSTMNAALPMKYGNAPANVPNQQAFMPPAGMADPNVSYHLPQHGQMAAPYGYPNAPQYMGPQTQYQPAPNFRPPYNAPRSAGTRPQAPNFPPQYMYYGGNYAGFPPSDPYNNSSQHARRHSLPYNQPAVPGPPYVSMPHGYSQGVTSPNNALGPDGLPSASSSLLSPVSRGPPRKPKQSGHALWVGNIPPGTTIVDLKDHFSRGATTDIESLFLISKSNCAFVNYKTEESCTAAMHRFHDSRFQGVRLVCRLRRSSAATSGAPSAPAALTGAARPGSSGGEAATAIPTGPSGASDDAAAAERGRERRPEKFFVLKSLTLQDLEASVRNGIWATQNHNEKALNEAYETADAVYLIFSANKSGEYFGYARMTSSIKDELSELDPASAPTQAASATSVTGTVTSPNSLSISAPKSIPTTPTEHAPRGRIIDDSARGTIFWEAERSDSEPDEADVISPSVEKSTNTVATTGTMNQEWGKPFRVEWLSTNKLPFYRTRGLRNPWNANREVKIARDGTELETSVGKRLVGMFHRPNGGPVAGNVPLVGGMPGLANMYGPPSLDSGTPRTNVPIVQQPASSARTQQQQQQPQFPAIVGNMPQSSDESHHTSGSGAQQ